MSVTRMRALVCVLVAALLPAFATGCGFGGGGDKAGGSSAPVELRLAVAYGADQPDAPFARDFASRVAELSGGSLRVRVVFDAAGHGIADPEARVARMVREGEFELGWIGARAWDLQGIRSFQALQAPFLVTSHALLGRIATGALAARMLAGLDDHGYVGLALVPQGLRYPTGVRRPLASLGDFAGARVRVIPSRATDALIRALGATPLHLGNEDVRTALANREIDGGEVSLGGPLSGANFLTMNVILFAKAVTLFADRNAFERLDDDQRAVIRKAAAETVAHVAAHPLSESALVRRFCDAGGPVSAVTASRDDLAALTRAAHPVYAELERDPQTKALIAAIRSLKAKTPAAPIAAAPPDCAHEPATSRRPDASPSTLNGTYRWRITADGARAVGGSADSPDVGNIVTMTLRDGDWLLGETDGGDTGTFTISEDQLVFDWPATASRLTFTFTRHSDGTLELKPVLPMDKGDRVVWASGPWRRIGTPVRDVP